VPGSRSTTSTATAWKTRTPCPDKQGDGLSDRPSFPLAALGARLAAGLGDAAREAGVALQVNAFGSALTPFFAERPVRDFAGATSANTDRYAAFFRGMLARGVYPPPS